MLTKRAGFNLQAHPRGGSPAPVAPPARGPAIGLEARSGCWSDAAPASPPAGGFPLCAATGRPHLRPMRLSSLAARAGLWTLGAGLSAVVTTALIKHRARRQIRLGLTREAGLPLLRAGPSAFPGLLWQATGTRFHGGNRVDWLFNGRIFEQLLEDLAQARRSVRIAIYIWQPGTPGDRLAQAVADCARRGLEVQVIVDPLGSHGFDEHLQPMVEAAGGQVRFFRSPGAASALRMASRHHRKMVVIDDRIAFTGGFGISEEWTGDGVREGCWRDTHVRVEGPVVESMLQTFAASWMEVAGELLRLEQMPPHPPPVAAGGSAAFVASREVAGWTHSFLLSWLSLGTAKERLWIANAYFYPPAELLELLCRKAREGVDVRLLLPGKHIDRRFVRLAQQTCYPPLLEAGARIFEYAPSMMHAKTVLVDRRLALVGSVNLDPLSLYWLEEGSLVIDDAEVAQGLADQWALDLSHAREIPAVRTRTGRLKGGDRPRLPARRMPNRAGSGLRRPPLRNVPEPSTKAPE